MTNHIPSSYHKARTLKDSVKVFQPSDCLAIELIVLQCLKVCYLFSACKCILQGSVVGRLQSSVVQSEKSTKEVINSSEMNNDAEI